MAIILISQGFRGVDFLRKPSVYLHFKAFAGPTNWTEEFLHRSTGKLSSAGTDCGSEIEVSEPVLSSSLDPISAKTKRARKTTPLLLLTLLLIATSSKNYAATKTYYVSVDSTRPIRLFETPKEACDALNEPEYIQPVIAIREDWPGGPFYKCTYSAPNYATGVAVVGYCPDSYMLDTHLHQCIDVRLSKGNGPSCNSTKNPIVYGTGNKWLLETDFAGTKNEGDSQEGGEFKLSRVYNVGPAKALKCR